MIFHKVKDLSTSLAFQSVMEISGILNGGTISGSVILLLQIFILSGIS